MTVGGKRVDGFAPKYAQPFAASNLLLDCVDLRWGWIKFRRFGNLHLYSAKAAGFVQYAFIIWALLLRDYPATLFYAAATLAIIASREGFLYQWMFREVNEHAGSLLRVLDWPCSRIAAGIVVAAAAGLGACYYESAVPLSAAASAPFDSSLIGEWKRVPGGAEDTSTALRIFGFNDSEYDMETEIATESLPLGDEPSRTGGATGAAERETASGATSRRWVARAL
ncbi:MAG: hypothetical protein HY703_02510 [Gemmatimonadetes bacterium]|nr:hypothetical protein [Gemmatimonadota bacterium]